MYIALFSYPLEYYFTISSSLRDKP